MLIVRYVESTRNGAFEQLVRSGNPNLKALPLPSLKYKYKTKNFLTLEI